VLICDEVVETRLPNIRMSLEAPGTLIGKNDSVKVELHAVRTDELGCELEVLTNETSLALAKR
jgi:hypothetical protein